MSAHDLFQGNAAAVMLDFQGVTATYTQPATTTGGLDISTAIKISLGPVKVEEFQDDETGGFKKIRRTRTGLIKTTGTDGIASPKTRDTVTIGAEVWSVVSVSALTGASAELMLAIVTRAQIVHKGAVAKSV